jgi:UDP-glucose 4-epimerase
LNNNGAHTWNFGTRKGYSVKEVVEAFSRGCDVDILCKIVARRPGDIAECWSDPGKARRELGWKAEKGLDEMMEDTWRWQSKNPEGYKGSEF